MPQKANNTVLNQNRKRMDRKKRFILQNIKEKESIENNPTVFSAHKKFWFFSGKEIYFIYWLAPFTPLMENPSPFHTNIYSMSQINLLENPLPKPRTSIHLLCLNSRIYQHFAAQICEKKSIFGYFPKNF